MTGSAGEAEKLHRRTMRLIVTGIAALLGSGIIISLVQSNVQEWAKANNQDQYLVKYAGPIMDSLAQVTQSTTFLAAAWAIIGGAVVLWVDYALRGRAAKKKQQEPPQGDTPSNLAISSRMVVRPPPATSPLLVPGRFYSTAEKERIVDTMNLIQQGLNNTGRKMMWEAEKVSSNPGHHDELDQSIERMRAVYAEAEKLSGDLEKVRNESHSYPVDFAVLLAAKPVYYDEFQRAVYDYSNALYVYRHLLPVSGEHRGALSKTLDSEKRHLSRAKHFLEKWMDECDEQMRGARSLLEK